jgi:hypothetical protein
MDCLLENVARFSRDTGRVGNGGGSPTLFRKVTTNLEASDKIASWDLSERRSTSLQILRIEHHEMSSDGDDN